jgi:hypothetical protein
MKKWILFLLIYFYFSCENKVAVDSKQLVGKWMFTKALRDGKETKTLDSAYLVFNADNSINSNVFQAAENKSYSVKHDELSISGKEESYKWQILDFHVDTLILEGKMGVFDMSFELQRLNH